MEGFEEECFCAEGRYEAESWISSGAEGPCLLPLRSYPSLELLSCSDEDEEDEANCRMIHLNNTIKRLLDVIRDPAASDNISRVSSLLCKFFKYNGNDGLYVVHLPHLGEILEYLCSRSKDSEELLSFLYSLLELCCKAPLVQRSSEILSAGSNLRRHFNVLGFLLVLAPTKDAFYGVKFAIESLLMTKDPEGADEGRRRNAVKPDALREAVEGSRLPVTLAEVLKLASQHIYPLVLDIVLAIVCASPLCCYRVLETKMDELILLRMHPAYENGFGCDPVTDDMDLQLDNEDYCNSLGRAVQILRQLMTSMVIPEDANDETLKNLKSPSKAAMWSLRAALRREVLRAGRSAKSRKLRNQLVSLIMANLSGCTAAPKWELVESGLAEDLGLLVTVTELGAKESWACKANFGTNLLEGLAFKRILLIIIALLVEQQPKSIEVFNNQKIIPAVLQLINPNVASAKMLWNNEQRLHLFKHASNALSYLAPKIPEEFIEFRGSMRLFLLLEEFLINKFDISRISCLIEMICVLVSSNCDLIKNDFRHHNFVKILHQMILRFMEFEAISIKYQKVITFILSTCESLLECESCSRGCCCGPSNQISVVLLKRCLHKKYEDSELTSSYLVAIGSFIWKSLILCPDSLQKFAKDGGIYLILDIIECSNLPVQNFYLGILNDLCERVCNINYLLTWRRASKKGRLLSLLSDIWRKEEQVFKVKRNSEGCINDIGQPIGDDDGWFYLYYTKSMCTTNTTSTTAIGAARQKIYHLKKLIMREVDKHQKDYYEVLHNELSTDDQITMLAIDAYNDLKVDEAALMISKALKLTQIRPLTRSRRTLKQPNEKLGNWATSVKKAQDQLVELHCLKETLEEQKELHLIRDSGLSTAFDVYRELSFIGRTGSLDFRRTKCEDLRKMADTELVDSCTDQPFLKTLDRDVNITTIFNLRKKIKSLEQKQTGSLKEVSV